MSCPDRISYFRILDGLSHKMELEPLFTSTKWDILKALSRRKYSPLELSIELHTSIANISQQLRLMEMAGLVKTERTSASEKGKPRVLYSIARDCAYLVVMMNTFSGKSLIPITPHMSAIMRIWLMPDQSLHSGAEASLRLVEPLAPQAVYVDMVARELVSIVASRDEKKRLEALPEQKSALKLRAYTLEEAKSRDHILSSLHPILMINHEVKKD